jgi:hypothetical protein
MTEVFVNRDSNADVRSDYEIVEVWDNYDGYDGVDVLAVALYVLME